MSLSGIKRSARADKKRKVHFTSQSSQSLGPPSGAVGFERVFRLGNQDIVCAFVGDAAQLGFKGVLQWLKINPPFPQERGVWNSGFLVV